MCKTGKQARDVFKLIKIQASGRVLCYAAFSMRTFFALLLACFALASCAAAPERPIDQPGSSSASSVTGSVVSSAAALPGLNETGLPLTIPAGFRMETMATGLSNARVIVQDGFGNFWVSRPDAGVVTQLEMSGSTVVRANDVLRGLRKPHGLAIDPANGMDLYIAEETAIKHVPLYSDGPLTTVTTLPAGGRHTSRTIAFGPDGRLYVSIGSTCDVCVEENDLHGTIISLNTDGTDQRIEAGGLRNAVFFTWHPVDGSMWATEMGRDMLGNDLPPEEINVIHGGRTYGWPFCYGDRVRDMRFQPQTQADCTQTEPPRYTLPAHTAPLGLAFIPEEGWPEEYWYDLLVAQHGSWNSTTPVGYKIVRIPLDAQGNREGDTVDFISGFRAGGTVHGRPVDLVAQPGGILYITDDRRGVVYRMTTQSEAR